LGFGAETEVESERGAALVDNVCEAGSEKRPPKRGRFATNLSANLGYFVFSTIIGIWFVPYLIRHLGTSSYGLIPLVTQITGYMAILTLSINSAVGRFMTISLERGEHDTANEYFNTSLLAGVVLALVLSGPVICAALYVDKLIDVPPDQVAQTQVLFVCAAAAFLLTALKMPFDVSTYCLNRFDLRNALLVGQKLVSVGFVVAIFAAGNAQIWHVGLGTVLGTCVAAAGSVWLWRTLTPSLRVAVSYCKWSAFRRLIALGGWTSVNAVGSLLFLGIDLIIVNHYFGPEAGGRYAAVLQWPILLRTIGATVAGVFGPTILYHYARRDMDGLTRYARRAVKCVGLTIALPVGLICGLGAPLLETWLGPDFVDLSWLLLLMTVHLCVNVAVTPCFNVQVATNRVRWPGIVTFLMGLVNLGLALLLAGPMGWGMYGVAAAGAIALTGKNLIYTPLYAAHILRCKWTTFFREVLPIIVAAVATLLAGKAIAASWDVTGWPRLILVGAAISGVYAACAYWVLLNRDDRGIVRRLLSGMSPQARTDTSSSSEDRRV